MWSKKSSIILVYFWLTHWKQSIEIWRFLLSFFFFPHFWLLKSSKITSFVPFEFWISIFGEISPIKIFKKKTASLALRPDTLPRALALSDRAPRREGRGRRASQKFRQTKRQRGAMLEQLLIFTRGGLLLWTWQELANSLKRSLVNVLIR